MRIVLMLSFAMTATGCGSMEYKDTNAAVNADPLCASAQSQPNEPASLRCQRKTEVSFGAEKSSEPLDLSGKSRDNDPR